MDSEFPHGDFPFGSVKDILGDIVDTLQHFGNDGVAYHSDQSDAAILERVSKLNNLRDLKELTSYIERRLKALFESREYLAPFRYLKDRGTWKKLYHYLNISKSFIMMADDFTSEDAVDHKNRSLRLCNDISSKTAEGISHCFKMLGEREMSSPEQKKQDDIASLLFASLEDSEQSEVRETIDTMSFTFDDVADDDIKNQTKLAFWTVKIDRE